MNNSQVPQEQNSDLPLNSTESSKALQKNTSEKIETSEIMEKVLSNKVASPIQTIASSVSTQDTNNYLLQDSTSYISSQDPKKIHSPEKEERFDSPQFQKEFLNSTQEILDDFSHHSDAETEASSPVRESQAQILKTQKDSQKLNEEKIGDEKRIYFIINCPVYVPKGQENFHEKINEIIQKIEENGFRSDHKKKKLLNNIHLVFGLNRSSTEGKKPEVDVNKIQEKFPIGGITFTWEPKSEEETKKSETKTETEAETEAEGEEKKGSNREHKKFQIPMREIRQRILESHHTRSCWKNIQKRDQNPVIYLMCIDDDTVNFNQVFSSYIDYVTPIIEKGDDPPAVMTTGYEFSKNIQDRKYQMAWFASRLDRIVRVTTSKILPWGTYYPEPNLCILVDPFDPSRNEILSEYFCKRYEKKTKTNKKGDFLWSNDNCALESPFILKQIFDERRRNKRFVVLDKPPLETATPKDVIKMLETKKAIKALRQNHFNPRNWARGLLFNWTPKNINKRDATPNLQSLFNKLDAQKIFVEKIWRKERFQNFKLYSNIEETYGWDYDIEWDEMTQEKLGWDDITDAAKFSQISALLWILAFNYPLTKGDEDIILCEGLIYFLVLYMKAAFNDDEMAKSFFGLMNFHNQERVKSCIAKKEVKYEELRKKIADHLQNLGSLEAPTEIGDFHNIIQEILLAKSPQIDKTVKNSKLSDNSGPKFFQTIEANFEDKKYLKSAFACKSVGEII